MHIGLQPAELAALRADTTVRLETRPRLYGICPGETGTNVLASIFTGVPADHEPEAVLPTASEHRKALITELQQPYYRTFDAFMLRGIIEAAGIQEATQ
jgi:hypothetical protein